jgi:ATP-binding cassette subfamily B protein RaxB
MGIPAHLFFRSRQVLPVITSTEMAECGLACLAMVASFHGHETDLNTLRQRYSFSMAGATLRGVMELADRLGLSTRALRVELEALRDIRLPAILHWDMNHFVVLKAIDRHGATIHDPARGKLTLSLKEVSDRFTGVALELFPAAHFQKLETRRGLRLSHLWSGIRGLRSSALFVVCLSIALQLITFILPFQLQLVVDQAVGRNDIDLLLVIAIGFGLVTLIQVVLLALRDWSLQLLGSQMVFQVAGNIFHHLIRLSASYFEKRHMGDILSRMGSIKTIQDAVTQGILSAVIDGSMVALACIALFLYSPLLAFIIIASVAIVMIITYGSYLVLTRQTENLITSMAKEQTHLMESIRAVIAIKLMGREAEREGSWRNLFSRSFNASVNVKRTELLTQFSQNLVLGCQGILVIYLAARSILTADGFSIGMLYAFLTFRGIFTERALMLLNQGQQIAMLRLYLDRLGDIVTEEAEHTHETHLPVAMRGHIQLNNVSFRYGATDKWILRNVNLEISDGDFVAITGPTGGGKTTLLKLLLGLQVPNEGALLLDGQTANPALWQSWRTYIGVVRQDDQLLSGSLADNISFFDPDINMERVWRAAIHAEVHNDIQKMPMGYLTLVGDMGSSLSGGQKQRVLLARALYRSPQILVLDEGTANLDPVTEETVSNMVASLSMTRIVVAHRPALVERASRVIRVHSGEVEIIR